MAEKEEKVFNYGCDVEAFKESPSRFLLDARRFSTPDSNFITRSKKCIPRGALCENERRNYQFLLRNTEQSEKHVCRAFAAFFIALVET
jgi:hypothetical protein